MNTTKRIIADNCVVDVELKPRLVVVFRSAGSFLPETTEVEFAAFDLKAIRQHAETITERYGTKPYGASVVRVVRAELPLALREFAMGRVFFREKFGFFYFGGDVLTYDAVGRLFPQERILLDNMRSNGWWVVVKSQRGSFQPLEGADAVIDDDGNIVARGTDFTSYATKMNEQYTRD